MEFLDLGGNDRSSRRGRSNSKSKTFTKKTLTVGGIASIAGLASTLAANITLNNSSSVEFGQGVAQMVTCDDDGFTVKPIAYYDNASSSFRVDYVEVSGVNLIPKGAESGSYNSSDHTYTLYGSSEDRAAHPNQYYDSSANGWKNTCDGIALDFKAYTDDPRYSINTVDGVNQFNPGIETPTTTSSPLYWYVQGNAGIVDIDNLSYSHGLFNSNVGVTFDATHGGNSTPDDFYFRNHENEAFNFHQNYASIWFNINRYSPWAMTMTTPGDVGGTWYVADSTFRIFPTTGHHASLLYDIQDEGSDPAAGAISKITVESMQYFPSDYYSTNNIG